MPDDTGTQQNPEGILRAPVTDWLAATCGLSGPLQFDRLTGGHSNFTYLVTDADGTTVVLRRPPLGELLPSAHDMSREWRAISALGPTPVPVPPALGFCDDPSVTGAWFYVMGHVPGHVLHDEETAVDAYDEAQRRRAGESLVDTLAALHAVDPDAVGLGDLGKKTDYVGRQLRRWYGQYQQSRGTDARIAAAHDHLAANTPTQQRPSIVHGDFRLGNCITDESGAIAAVLDWEICTLGDPLADLGYLLATWAEPDEPNASFATITSPSVAPGFPNRAEMTARYDAASDLDCSEIQTYVGFSFWKLACINQGVWDRYDQGQKATDDVDVDGIRESVDVLAQRAVEALGL